MNIPRIICRIVLCVAACSMLIDATATRAGDPFEGIDPYIDAALERWQVPGLAIAVVKDGEIVLARGYGLCEIGTDRNVTADSAFDIASCEKSFVATCVALLVEEGKLHWDDPVVKHLPEFELADPYLTEHVTLRDLLCHRTGLRRADLLGEATRFDTSGSPAPTQVSGTDRRIAHEVHLQQSHVHGAVRSRGACFRPVVSAIRR